jgi:hypothetical protein
MGPPPGGQHRHRRAGVTVTVRWLLVLVLWAVLPWAEAEVAEGRRRLQQAIQFPTTSLALVGSFRVNHASAPQVRHSDCAWYGARLPHRGDGSGREGTRTELASTHTRSHVLADSGLDAERGGDAVCHAQVVFPIFFPQTYSCVEACNIVFPGYPMMAGSIDGTGTTTGVCA